jgi:hypothetical protein
LDERNTYFYTKYEGFPFLQAWQENRQEIIARWEGETSPPQKINKTNINDIIQGLEHGVEVKTFDLFGALYGSLLSKDFAMHNKTFELINIIVRKFEVTKRIHKTYSKEFKAVDKEDYRDLEIYICAAEIFVASYSISRNLAYLNVLLKCNDTLCAMEEKLDLRLKPRLARLLIKERSHVSELADSVGVKI